MSEADTVERLEATVTRLQGMVDQLTSELNQRRDVTLDHNTYLIEKTRQSDPSENIQRKPHPELPDPRLIEKILRMRRLRGRYFKPDLFADPAWDILLELCAAHSHNRQVSVTSLCIGANVPTTTAMRWIALMTEEGLLNRRDDPLDRRRVYIAITDDVARALARYFDKVGGVAKHLV